MENHTIPEKSGNPDYIGWKKRTAVFLLSQGISLFGSSMVNYAIVWYVTLKTSSGAMMTITILTSFFPQIIIGFFAGVWADRACYIGSCYLLSYRLQGNLAHICRRSHPVYRRRDTVPGRKLHIAPVCAKGKAYAGERHKRQHPLFYYAFITGGRRLFTGCLLRRCGNCCDRYLDFVFSSSINSS